MEKKNNHTMREILVFGAAVALAGILATLISNSLVGIADSRDKKVLARLFNSDSAAMATLQADYPVLGSKKLYALNMPKGIEYGTMIASSIPGSSGLFAALFSADGEVISLFDVTAEAPISIDHSNSPLAQFIGYSAAKNPGTAPLIFDPGRFEFAKTIESISFAISNSRGKASNQ